MTLTRTMSTTMAVLAVLTLTGCQQYTTPGAGVSMASLTGVDNDIAERFRREPRAEFPARLAVARVQGPEYRSYAYDSYGKGRFSLVTARDLEQEADAERLQSLPMLRAVAPLNRMVVPPELQSDQDLRLAAASLKADMLLTYTFDTLFRVDETDLGPLEVVTLAFLPNKMARVSTTASAALFDVRTGFVYGLCEATARTEKLASSWSRQSAIDAARAETEKEAYAKLLEEFQGLWKRVVEEHGRK